MTIENFIKTAWYDPRASTGELEMANFLRSCVGMETDKDFSIKNLLYSVEVEVLKEIMILADRKILHDKIMELNPPAIGSG
jgi:hypothetical protein